MRQIILAFLLLGSAALVGCGESKAPENRDTTDPDMTSAPEAPK